MQNRARLTTTKNRVFKNRVFNVTPSEEWQINKLSYLWLTKEFCMSRQPRIYQTKMGDMGLLYIHSLWRAVCGKFHIFLFLSFWVFFAYFYLFFLFCFVLFSLLTLPVNNSQSQSNELLLNLNAGDITFLNPNKAGLFEGSLNPPFHISRRINLISIYHCATVKQPI